MKATTVAATATATTAAVLGFGIYLAQNDAILVDFSRTPASIDVTSATAEVTCNMTLTPIGDPLQDAVCAMISPAGISRSCLATSAVGDVWSCPIKIDIGSEQGIGATPWTIDYITTRTLTTPLLFDKWTHDEMLGLSLPSVPDAAALAIDVTSSIQDIVPPTISLFEVFPASTTQDTPVTCRISAGDAGVGIETRGCTFVSPSGNQQVSCVASGVNDSCSTSLILGGQAQETGLWTEVNHFATDYLGNRTLIEGTASFTVTAASPTDPTCSNKTPDASASNGIWYTSSLQTAAFQTLTFSAYMRASNVNGVLAVSSVSTATFIDSAILVRCSTSSNWDARNGTAYAADVTLPCVLGEWYKVTINADMVAKTYSVDVGTCDQAPTTIATNYAFRTGAPTTGGMDYYNLWSEFGTVDVQGVAWGVGACTPVTCAAYDPNSCGAAPDGCGGPALSCGACTAPDVCETGVYQCCTPSLTVCTDPVPDYLCGDWPDACGGTVNCGTCGGGFFCSNGQCVAYGVGGDPYVHVNPSDVGVTIGAGSIAPLPTTIYTGSMSPPAGALIENVVINGCMRIDQDNITMRNVIINCSATYPVRIDAASGFTIEYSKIDCTSSSKQFRFVGAPNVTVRNIEGKGCQDYFYIEDGNGMTLDGLLVENSYFHSNVGSSTAHADGFQIGECAVLQPPDCGGSGNMIIRGNYFYKNNPTIGATDIMFSTDESTAKILMESNLLRIFGRQTLRNVGKDSDLIARYNVYHQEFKTALPDPGQVKPTLAYRLLSTNAGIGVFDCNRYEDGTFVEQIYVSDDGGKPVTYNIANCPPMP